LGEEVGGGVVECETPKPLWLPYVEVADIAETTERARRLGASVLLGPREGPAGWRSVVAAPAAGEIAFWQPKEPSRANLGRAPAADGCKSLLSG
jgi:predicted enzyme related to lactoylglutathione lyase